MSSRSDYQERYRDPRWQKKRLEILERDNFICKRCGAEEKELHVHHTRYIKDAAPWEYPWPLLITLCTDCHEDIHDGDTFEEEWLGAFLRHIAPDSEEIGRLGEAFRLVTENGNGLDWVGPATVSYPEWDVIVQAVRNAMASIMEARRKEAA